jgi:hypothetical protein
MTADDMLTHCLRPINLFNKPEVDWHHPPELITPSDPDPRFFALLCVADDASPDDALPQHDKLINLYSEARGVARSTVKMAAAGATGPAGVLQVPWAVGAYPGFGGGISVGRFGGVPDCAQHFRSGGSSSSK